MEKTNRILDLGKLDGRILVFGGVYSNLQALEALMDIANKEAIPYSNLICTGDIVAYAADPEACVALIREAGIRSIAGNVEMQLAAGEMDCACDFVEGGRCDTFSKQWYPFAQQQLSIDSIEWMRQLPEFIQFEFEGNRFFVLHGSYHYTSEFIFQSTLWDIKAKNFADTHADVILAGHCGLPFSQQRDNQFWLNPGVIGMPANDGTPRVWYMILENGHSGWTYAHRSLSYDYLRARQLMLDRSLPPTYAETLKTGIWDNCEILPPEETKQQGIALSLEQTKMGHP